MSVTRLAGFVLCLCLVAACGAPAKSPADADTDVETSGADGETSGATPGEASEPSAARAAKTESAAPASKDELEAVLQLVIDDEELTPYLHLERTDRFPIRIAGDLPADLRLTKATQPVQIVDTADAKGKPVIVFTEIEIEGDSASVRYRYDVEGVRGSATLSKRDGRWVLARSRVTAR